jgi:hypothetical protein
MAEIDVRQYVQKVNGEKKVDACLGNENRSRVPPTSYCRIAPHCAFRCPCHLPLAYIKQSALSQSLSRPRSPLPYLPNPTTHLPSRSPSLPKLHTLLLPVPRTSSQASTRLPADVLLCDETRGLVRTHIVACTCTVQISFFSARALFGVGEGEFGCVVLRISSLRLKEERRIDCSLPGGIFALPHFLHRGEPVGRRPGLDR